MSHRPCSPNIGIEFHKPEIHHHALGDSGDGVAGAGIKGAGTKPWALTIPVALRGTTLGDLFRNNDLTLEIDVIHSAKPQVYDYDIPPTAYADRENVLSIPLRWGSVKHGETRRWCQRGLINTTILLDSGFNTVIASIRNSTKTQGAPATPGLVLAEAMHTYALGVSPRAAKRDLVQGMTLKEQRLLDDAQHMQRKRHKVVKQYRGHERHPALFDMNLLRLSDVFVPDLIKALGYDIPSETIAASRGMNGVRVIDYSTLTHLAPSVAPSGIHRLSLFQDSFLTMLLEEIENFQNTKGVDIHRPNSMNNYGVVLDEMGLYDTLQALIETALMPVTAALFPEWGGARIDSHHAFVVEYALGKDLDLDKHMDQSDLTINVCLGRNFTGGSVYFHGVRNDKKSEGIENRNITLAPGQGIIHAGQHWHGANPLTSGSRVNMILWLRSRWFQQSAAEHWYTQEFGKISHVRSHSSKERQSSPPEQ